MARRTCIQCGKAKELSDDNFRKSPNRKGELIYFRKKCRDCERIYSLTWNRDHAEFCRKRTADFTSNNPDYKSSWKENNKDRVAKYQKDYESRIHIKLKKRVSRAIKRALVKRGSKKEFSTLLFLPYSIEELKRHLESKFESWMSWENWGIYNPSTWDENNPVTWTWQLDHIKPMANHVYSCQTDPEFIDAWRLENLRPLRSKDNIILGAKMKRNKLVYGGSDER